MAIVKCVGGPYDGRDLDVSEDSPKVIVPVKVSGGMDRAIWVEEDQPMPGYIDAFGDWHMGAPPVYEDHVYRRGGDGQMHYEGKWR